MQCSTVDQITVLVIVNFSKLTIRPGFPGQSRFGILCPGIPNVVFGMPKCPGLASEVPDGTECYPGN